MMRQEKKEKKLSKNFLFNVVLVHLEGLLDEVTARPDLSQGEFSVSLADGAREAEDTLDARTDGALINVVLLNDLAAEHAGGEGEAEETEEAVGHVTSVDLAVFDGFTLAADGDAEAHAAIHAGGGIQHALAETGLEFLGHFTIFSRVFFGFFQV